MVASLLPLAGGFGASHFLPMLLRFLAQKAGGAGLAKTASTLGGLGGVKGGGALLGGLGGAAGLGAFVGVEQLLSGALGEGGGGSLTGLQQLPQPPITANDRNFLELLQQSQIRGTLPLALEETGISPGGLV